MINYAEFSGENFETFVNWSLRSVAFFWLPNSALIRGESFFLGCLITGGGDGEQGGVGKLEALVISSDCNHERLVNSASTPYSSLCMVSLIVDEARPAGVSISATSVFILTAFHHISAQRVARTCTEVLKK